MYKMVRQILLEPSYALLLRIICLYHCSSRSLARSRGLDPHKYCFENLRQHSHPLAVDLIFITLF